MDPCLRGRSGRLRLGRGWGLRSGYGAGEGLCQGREATVLLSGYIVAVYGMLRMGRGPVVFIPI